MTPAASRGAKNLIGLNAGGILGRRLDEDICGSGDDELLVVVVKDSLCLVMFWTTTPDLARASRRCHVFVREQHIFRSFPIFSFL